VYTESLPVNQKTPAGAFRPACFYELRFTVDHFPSAVVLVGMTDNKPAATVRPAVTRPTFTAKGIRRPNDTSWDITRDPGANDKKY
jgi:hypothetical protein